MQRRLPVAILSILLLAWLCSASAIEAGRPWDSRYEEFTGRSVPAAWFVTGDFEGGPNPCVRTAKVARQACNRDADDDQLTQLGNCYNLSDPDEAMECVDDARETRSEDRELCKEREDARIELCELLDEVRYDPEIDPDSFLSPDEIAADPNPYFPLVPGNTWTYENEEEIIEVTVTDETIEILGVTCIVVRDVVSLKEEDGELIEDTVDWYGQDEDGNVWYFGEIAQNFEDGRLVDLEGSWTAGQDYAKLGILVPAEPYAGLAYRQEFLLREAEDVAVVVSTTADESVDYVSCDEDCLQTLEFTPIEPDVAEYKFYLPGLGLILELDPESGDRTELVDFTAAP